MDQARALMIAGGAGAGEGSNGCGNSSAAGGAGGNSFAGTMPTMRGIDGAINVNTGGGGGYFGGTGSTRLRAGGTCVGGAEGGSNYLAPAVASGVSLAGTEAVTLPKITVNNPPQTADPNYVTSPTPPTGVGTVQNALWGGHGLVLIQYIAPTDLSIAKTDGTTSFTPGTTKSYTVTVSNSGSTATNAQVADLLPAGITNANWECAGVTGGATCNQASGTGAMNTTANVPSGGTVTYTVTINIPASFTGDLVNTATVAVPAGQVDSNPANNSATDTDQYSMVHYRKTITPSSSDPITPGQVFTYTVTVRNVGFTNQTGLTFTDDLSEVIDDATYDSGSLTFSAGTATVDVPSEQVQWSGNLAAGQTATVQYSFTINNPVSGNDILRNGIIGTGPGTNCSANPAIDPECFTIAPLPNIEVEKSLISPANPKAGDVVNYEVTLTNMGAAAASGVSVADSLVGVLDDASYTSSSAPIGNVTFDPATRRVIWNGNLAAAGSAGDSVTVAVSVTVNDADILGDGVLNNSLIAASCPNPAIFDSSAPGFDADCVTVTPIQAWIAQKTASTANTAPSGIVTYNIEVRNTGGANLSNIVLNDDMSDVLDDTSYNNDAAATIGAAPTLTGSTLSWTGNLNPRQVATISYSVTTNQDDALTNNSLANAITGPMNCAATAITDPTDPAYNSSCATLTTIAPTPPTVVPPMVPGTGSADDLANTGQNLAYLIFAAVALLIAGVSALLFRSKWVKQLK